MGEGGDFLHLAEGFKDLAGLLIWDFDGAVPKVDQHMFWLHQCDAKLVIAVPDARLQDSIAFPLGLEGNSYSPITEELYDQNVYTGDRNSVKQLWKDLGGCGGLVDSSWEVHRQT